MNNRVKRLQEELVKNNIDYAIIGPTSNMQYLIDFIEEQMERPLLLIISQDDYYILAPKLYEEQLSKFPLIVYSDGENPYSKLNLKENSSLLIDDKLYSLFTIEILSTIKSRRVYRASTILDKLRMVKDEDEISRMSEGVRIAEELFLRFIQTLTEGLTECEIQRKFKSYIIENAGEISFEPILTSGPNTSMPHLKCTERKVKKGDVIIFDFGIKYKGYSTDTTRVVSLGNPSDLDVKKIFEIVKEANEAAERFARKGVLASEIDLEARKIIEINGYGKFFIHRTGHGIGIDVHEAPYISSDNNEKIENGEIFTIEPGIYLPNKFGIRIEDEILIHYGTSKVLNSLDKELFII
ncbi:X-pro aminopeptidase [Sulfolobus sp. A20]|uniref:M24 family metallopeptidase n=1 Tax=Sulfolobaceae TaxID=118883 RepID=UPI000845BF38|nr:MULTISPECIES: Xaa-Pro peptidase family protein [unclassified Sulfolobus]TRM76427.1 aminopeptidase P family protein [Sulfolobus sp. A20-N-F8]TRM76653.1 aminopeptidase P family protein [Sulfolobus sp. B5]TRN02452.1 aminopeptidase P family protein [Sulfolobus sp. F1]TRN04200.1 aminopeptidase P family protein [Sulfolobus sp. E1]AOL16297.1 X-pro aminopeptidase [Sulfolobus sp. A20]